MIEGILQKIGLNDKEVRVYLACLKLGPSAVRRIAETADINRGTAYDVLKSLMELGLISYYHQDKHQYFIAEDPSKLKDALKQKQQNLIRTEEEVDRIIPQLKSLYDKGSEKPVAKYYEGLAGIRTILQDVIDTCQSGSKEYYVYSSSTIKKHLYDAYHNFSQNRIKAGVKVKVISIGPGGKTIGLDDRKWLTKKESAPTYTLIYDNKMAMISVEAENKPIGVIVEDKNIYQTQKITFEFIWQKI